MLTKTTWIEYEDLDRATVPHWVINQYVAKTELELTLDITWTKSVPETRTDPADPGELFFDMTISDGRKQVDFDEAWITHAAWERLNEFAEAAANEYAMDEAAAYGDYLYEQAKERKAGF